MRGRDFQPRHLLPHAAVALSTYLRPQPQERLVVAWDETVSTSVYEAFRTAAQSQGIEATAVVYEPVAERQIMDYGLFAGRSLLPPLKLPRVLRAALDACDVFVLLGSDTELLFSPDVAELLESGKRGLFLPYHDAGLAYRLLFRTEQEADDHSVLMNAVGRAVEDAQEVRVASAEGTDLRFRLGQYRTLKRAGKVEPGQLQILPAGSVVRVPDAGTAVGTLVIDRTVCANDYKQLQEPIELQIAAGKVVAITGGMEAKLLRTFLEGLEDERAFHLTEMGIGTNPLCRWSGIGAPSEDTHVQGTVAFALGCDTHIGGQTPAPVHVDMTMRFPDLWLNGQQIVEGGRLLLA